MKTKNSIPTSFVTALKRLFSPRANLFIALSVWAALFSLQPAHAQKSNVDALTKAELQQMQNIMKTVDEKIMAGFKGQEALQTEMTKELKLISVLKDSAEQKKAAATYKAKYLKSYSGVLSKAKVDLSAVAKQLQGVAPRFQFLALPDLSIVGKVLKKTTSLAPTPVAKGTTKITKIDQFVDVKSLSCSLAAGGDVTFTSSSITTTAGAAVAGGCHNEGEKKVTVMRPAGALRAILTVEADLSAEAFAVGVIASSAAITGASSAGPEFYNSVYVAAFAPVFWIGSAEESLEGQSNTWELVVGSSNSVSFKTDATVFAPIGGGSSKGKVKNIAVSLTVTE